MVDSVPAYTCGERVSSMASIDNICSFCFRTCKTKQECVIIIHVNERCRRKEERSKQGQTNNKAKQHITPKDMYMYMYTLYQVELV